MRRAVLLLLTYVAVSLTLIAAALVSMPARGQTPAGNLVDSCTGLPAVPPVFIYVDVDLRGVLRCEGATPVTRRSNLQGIVAWRYCKRPDGAYAPQWTAASWTWLAAQPGLVTRLGDVLAKEGFNPSTETLQQLARDFPPVALAQPEVAKAWCPFWPEIWRGIPQTPPPPPAPAWKVAACGSVQQTCRAYAVTADGKRGAQTLTVRAPVGAACDCAKPIVEGLATYCPWTGSGALITQCTKGTP